MAAAAWPASVKKWLNEIGNRLARNGSGNINVSWLIVSWRLLLRG